jgi:hypothetical protein
MVKKRRKRLSEDEALLIVLGDHPQWRRQWEDGTLPDEITGEDGEPMSPRMHIEVHIVVERQLADDEPAGVIEVAQELEQLGLSRHDIRHEISRAVAGQLWHMDKEGCAFDEGRYLLDLREIVESRRQDGTGN